MVAEVYAPEYVEYMAANGDIKEVLLADGTHVYLNAQSRLNCEKSLTGATRDVFLCGEAFFEVAKDTLHPFIVHAAGTQIKVTGTKFNVRAFPDEDNSTTTLVEGGVEVRIPGQATYHRPRGLYKRCFAHAKLELFYLFSGQCRRTS